MNSEPTVISTILSIIISVFIFGGFCSILYVVDKLLFSKKFHKKNWFDRGL
ncbi:MAG: hypothetical protein IKS15_03835 [Opitutales bacterium]|nr:hypothetical protein [Opitutales bacterium]